MSEDKDYQERVSIIEWRGKVAAILENFEKVINKMSDRMEGYITKEYFEMLEKKLDSLNTSVSNIEKEVQVMKEKTTKRNFIMDIFQGMIIGVITSVITALIVYFLIHK